MARINTPLEDKQRHHASNVLIEIFERNSTSITLSDAEFELAVDAMLEFANEMHGPIRQEMQIRHEPRIRTRSKRQFTKIRKQ